MRRLLLLFCQMHSEFALKPSEIFEVGVGFGYYHYFFLEGEVRFLIPTDSQNNDPKYYTNFFTDVYYSVGFGFQYDFGFVFFEYFKFGLLYNLIHQEVSCYHKGLYFATCFLMLSLISNKFFEFGLQYTFFDSSLSKFYFGLLENYKKEDSWMFYFRVYFPIKKCFKAHFYLSKVSFNFDCYTTANHEAAHAGAAIKFGAFVSDAICFVSGGGSTSYSFVHDVKNNIHILLAGAASELVLHHGNGIISHCKSDFSDIAQIIQHNCKDPFLRSKLIYELNPKGQFVNLYLFKDFCLIYSGMVDVEMDIALQVYFYEMVDYLDKCKCSSTEELVQILIDHRASFTLVDANIKLAVAKMLLGENNEMKRRVDFDLEYGDWSSSNEKKKAFFYSDKNKMKKQYLTEEEEIKNYKKIKEEYVKLKEQTLSKSELLQLKKDCEKSIKIGEKRLPKFSKVCNDLKNT